MKVVHNKIVYADIITKVIYAAVILCVVVLWIHLYQSETFDQVRPIEGDGEYVLHHAALIPRDSPDILIAEDDKLYLFYTNTELLNVYTTSGDYLYGFQFPDGQNGKSGVHCKNGFLYVNARGSGIYVFQDTQLLRFEEQHYLNSGYDELESMFTGEDDHQDGEYIYEYVKDTNTILRSNQDGAEVVLQFPARKYDPSSFALLLLLLILLGRFIWGEGRRRSGVFLCAAL